MNRRQLLGSAGAAGVYLARRGRARAAVSMTPRDVFWVHLQADGGWDPGLFCDPKVNLRGAQIAAKLPYFRSEVSTAKTTFGPGINYLGFADFELPAEQGFFSKYADNLLVLAGIDCKTIDHNLGQRYNSTGSTNTDFPSIAASIAVANGAGQPLAFLEMSGFSYSANEISPARLGDNGAQWISRFLNPNSVTGKTAVTYTRPESVNLVRQAQERRLARLMADTKLVGPHDAMERLLGLRQGLGQLGALDLTALNGDFRTADMVFVKQAEGAVPGPERYRYPQMLEYRRFQIELGLEAFKKHLTSAMTMAGMDNPWSENTTGTGVALLRCGT